MGEDADDRLVRAVERVSAEELADFAFRLSDSNTSARGSSVSLVNEAVAIRFVADWLEGEIHITLEPIGGPPQRLDTIVDLSGAGVSLSRISRGATSGMIYQRVRTVAELLVAQAPEGPPRARS